MDTLPTTDYDEDVGSYFTDSLGLFVNRLLEVDEKWNGTILSDHTFTQIAEIVKSSFTRICNLEQERMFTTFSKTKAYRFPSLICLLNARIFEDESVSIVECVIGIWLSARYISRGCLTNQKYISRAFFISWPYFRIGDPECKTISVWDHKEGWVAKPMRFGSLSIIGKSVSTLSDLSDIVGFWDILKEIDSKYNVGWRDGKRSSKSTPAKFKNLRFNVDSGLENTNLDEPAVTDELVVQCYEYMNDILNDDDESFSLQTFKDRVSHGINTINYDPFRIDVCSAYITKNHLRSIKFSNNKLFIFDKSDRKKITLQSFTMTPGFIELAISSVKFEEDIKCVRAAEEYVKRSYTTEDSKNGFWTLCLASLMKVNWKKLYWMYGEKGDEGKSVSIKIIGPIGGAPTVVGSESIFGFQKTTASGHTAHLTDIDMASMINITDAPNKSLAEGPVKQYTGGDALYTRDIGKGKKVIEIQSPLVVVSNFPSNVLPGASFALFNRLFNICPDATFIAPGPYREKACRICSKCKKMYSLGPNVETINCPHTDQGYLLDPENDFKWNIKDEFLNIERLQQGILFLAMKKFQEEYDKYVTNVDDILNNTLQMKHRWDMFIRCYKIDKILNDNYEDKDVEGFLENTTTLKRLLLRDRDFRNKLHETVGDGFRMSSSGWKNYHKCVDGFIEHKKTKEYQEMIIKTLKDQAISRMDMRH